MPKSSEILSQFRSIALVALGSNMGSSAGDATETVLQGLQLLRELEGVIRSTSHFYDTPAFPEGSGPDYVNAVTVMLTNATPTELMSALHGIEEQLGRKRIQRWGQRSLDLDLIAFDDLVWPDMKTYRTWVGLPLERQMKESPEQLILPHPRLQERPFVLVPLAEAAPDWVHPVSGLTASEMLSSLPDAEVAKVVPAS